MKISAMLPVILLIINIIWLNLNVKILHLFCNAPDPGGLLNRRTQEHMVMTDRRAGD